MLNCGWNKSDILYDALKNQSESRTVGGDQNVVREDGEHCHNHDGDDNDDDDNEEEDEEKGNNDDNNEDTTFRF